MVLVTFLLRGNLRWWHRRREIMPLLGTLGFMLIGASVSGLDATSGLFLGFGLLVEPASQRLPKLCHSHRRGPAVGPRGTTEFVKPV